MNDFAGRVGAPTAMIARIPMLATAAVKAARPRAAAYKLADERGLHLFVAPTGLKAYRMRFRIGGREQLLTIGSELEISLQDARDWRDLARAALARGEDPRANMHHRDANMHAALTFEAIGRRWIEDMRPRWSAVRASDVLGSLERDVFPAIGAMPIGAITVPVTLAALRAIEARGTLTTAQRVHQRLRKIFAFAMAEDLVATNPAAVLDDALTPPPPPQNHPALTDIADVRAMLEACDRLNAAPATIAASRFLAFTAARLAMVTGATWAEIEDLDGPAPLWRVPARRMKLKVARKADAKNDHVVPLSRQAVELLRRARDAAGATPAAALIFPAGAAGRPIDENALFALYKRTEFAGRHVAHGWRASFSTIMHEEEHDHHLIERALAHSLKDKVAAAYNRGSQIEQRRALMQAWADLLTGA